MRIQNAAALLAVAASLAGCGSSPETSSTTSASGAPPTNADKAAENAKKLVEISKQEPVSPTDPDVVSIQHDLLALSHKCREDIPTLAGEIDSGVEIRGKEGIHESPVVLAAAMDKAAPGKKVTSDCRGILAALLTMMEQEHG